MEHLVLFLYTRCSLIYSALVPVFVVYMVPLLNTLHNEISSITPLTRHIQITAYIFCNLRNDNWILLKSYIHLYQVSMKTHTPNVLLM